MEQTYKLLDAAVANIIVARTAKLTRPEGVQSTTCSAGAR